MNHLEINGHRDFGASETDFVSNQDQYSFNNALFSQNSRTTGGVSHRVAQLNKTLFDQLLKGSKEINKSSLEQAAGYVLTTKNKMLIESRANSFKKAAEVAKEISF